MSPWLRCVIKHERWKERSTSETGYFSTQTHDILPQCFSAVESGGSCTASNGALGQHPAFISPSLRWHVPQSNTENHCTVTFSQSLVSISAFLSSIRITAWKQTAFLRKHILLITLLLPSPMQTSGIIFTGEELKRSRDQRSIKFIPKMQVLLKYL